MLDVKLAVAAITLPGRTEGLFSGRGEDIAAKDFGVWNRVFGETVHGLVGPCWAKVDLHVVSRTVCSFDIVGIKICRYANSEILSSI